jgi:hypothetical protein
MTAEKNLTRVSASVQLRGVNGNTRTGKVELRAIPGWLKSDQFAIASLSPRQAMLLAHELLYAALRVTEKPL